MVEGVTLDLDRGLDGVGSARLEAERIRSPRVAQLPQHEGVAARRQAVKDQDCRRGECPGSAPVCAL